MPTSLGGAKPICSHDGMRSGAAPMSGGGLMPTSLGGAKPITSHDGMRSGTVPINGGVTAASGAGAPAAINCGWSDRRRGGSVPAAGPGCVRTPASDELRRRMPPSLGALKDILRRRWTLCDNVGGAPFAHSDRRGGGLPDEACGSSAAGAWNAIAGAADPGSCPLSEVVPSGTAHAAGAIESPVG